MKRTKIILIGQAPARTGDPRAALEGRLGTQLSALFCCTQREYLDETQRFNVVPRWPGKNGKGDAFPLSLARQNARRMRGSFGDCRVLFVGIETAHAFDVTHQLLRWKQYRCLSGKFHAAILPHPSGINHWWNDVANRYDAARFMRRAWRLAHG